MEETKKGKNFSKVNRGQRRAGDFYQTPYSMTVHLLNRLQIRSFPVLEPADGFGAITQVLWAAYGCSRVDHFDLEGDGIDFLKWNKKVPWVITNPPFTLSTEFIRQCKKIATKGFALLMPIEYLHGKERYEEFYKEANGYPLTRVLIFTRRAMLTDEVREDGKYDTGMITWCWYIWERKPLRYNKPIIEWIDNDGDVLRNGRVKKKAKH